ncbi:MAG: type I restriction enzyme HsdR N-terminal domain-containing protein [Bacteroidales bacterium]|jgi:type I site-specific restriction-modification system R (restriction) subunit|nr:type I restriction enzyme HsdR N-terminal domain-containing protein [Bacteroidales bacterium]
MLRQRQKGEKIEVFDPIRKRWVPLTEEEKVRQFLISYLMNEKRIPASHISVERKIIVNGLTKRYDLVVFDSAGVPAIVIECKAPHVAITQEVLTQAGRYNKTLRAPVIGVSNGKTNYFFKIDFETEAIEILPDFFI